MIEINQKKLTKSLFDQLPEKFTLTSSTEYNSETLHLSDKKKAIMLSVYQFMEQELNNGIDEFSQEVIIVQIELDAELCKSLL